MSCCLAEYNAWDNELPFLKCICQIGTKTEAKTETNLKIVSRKISTEKTKPLPGMAAVPLVHDHIRRGRFLCLGKPMIDTRRQKSGLVPSDLFHRFLSGPTLNFVDLKPLDFISFTGALIRKNAPNFVFYFLGGHFLVCDI